MKGTLTNPVRVMKRAVKCMNKDMNRPSRCAVHLDECGDVVATDSYRMSIERNVWDGPSMEIPAELARWMAKRKVSAGERATISEKDGRVKAAFPNGEKFACEAFEGKYPNYKHLERKSYNTVAYVKPKLLLPVIRELVRQKEHVVIGVYDRNLRISASNVELPEGRFEKACDGEDAVIAFNAAYLRDALDVFDKNDVVEIRIEGAMRPAVIAQGGIKVLVMPINRSADEQPQSKHVKGIEKKEETVKPLSLKGKIVTITGTLPTMTRKEAFTKLELVGGVPCENFTSKTTLFVIADKAGRNKREQAERAIAKGQEVRIVDGCEFEKALAAAFAAPVKAEKPKAEKPKSEKPKAPKPPKAPAEKPKAPAVKPAEVKAPDVETLLKELAELKAALKSQKASTASWKAKAQEYYDEGHKEQDAATVVSLEAMLADARKWCESRPNTCANRKRGNLSAVRINGVGKEDAELHGELIKMGYRYSKKGFWYFGEREAQAQGKTAVDGR